MCVHRHNKPEAALTKIDLFSGSAPAPFESLPARQARCILADPPWRFRNFSAKGDAKNPNQHYACMSIADIKALPVRELADPEGCALTMWTTSPFLALSLEVLAAWGFTYKAFVPWAKQTSTGKSWMFGPGYIYRGASEIAIVGTTGAPKRVSRSIRNLIVAPVREHSRKPDQMRADLETLWPGPRIELFAREPAPGWLSWGNETTKFEGRSA
jgi:N6-adenosine-specific RNA methylase IME4